MKGKPGDKQRLLHIADAINEIESYINGKDLEEFLSNSMMRFASIKQIEIIGEAVYFLSSETKAKYADIEWDKIAGIRHILVHEYFGIDDKIVWQIITTDIPALKEKVKNILAQFE
jgi:uncharacterized protein with HEPN domain